MPQSMGEIDYESQLRDQQRYAPKKKEKKWTLGSLFRRKKQKESDSESSDSDTPEDRKKRGFLARRRRKRTANRGSKDVSQSFEHVILRPGGGSISSDGSRKSSLKARVEANRDSMLKDSSSEDERSPRPRAPRSKRSSRDMTDCHMKVMELDSSPRSPRWTAKVVYCESSDYEARYTAHTRSATPSPAQSPVARVKLPKRPPIPHANPSRLLHCQKSASFDLLPRHTPAQQQLYNNPQPRIPPPPPPRDPQRKIIPPLGYQHHDRPLSYAFESNQPISKVMTDHNSNITAYKINSSTSLDHKPVYKFNSDGYLDHQPVYKLNSNGSLDQQPNYRVNNSCLLEQPVCKASATGSLDKRRTYQYYTDQQPRSRRPIHIARVDQPYLSDSQVSGRLKVNDWHLPRDSNSSLYDSSDSREGGMECRPLSMVVESTERLSQQQLPQPQELSIEKDHQKRKSSNLEDALNELEAIYKSLQLRDEEPSLHRGFESDSGYSYRVVDDMAYRRLNRRDSGDSPDCRRVVSQAGSYLLVSPTLSPPPFAIAPSIPAPLNEPDVTLDDVVYRSIRHTNNTLKISDPQPPFGIPLGPIAPAPSSDYLHAAPKQLYRPTFKPRKTPDIVKDDLAYRNLRKDGQHDSLLTNEESNFLSQCESQPQSILKKKRAVRSLSANLLSIIQKEQFNKENQDCVTYMDNRDNHFEKTQSYSDLPDVLCSRYKMNHLVDDVDVTPRASRLYSDLPISTTSTETLTDSRTNIMNLHQSPCLPPATKRCHLPSSMTNISLPKNTTDFEKRISPPKKYLQNVVNCSPTTDVDVCKQYEFNSSSNFNNYLMKNSSPSNSLNVHRQPSKQNGSVSPGSSSVRESKLDDYKTNLTSLHRSLSQERNIDELGIHKSNSPGAVRRHNCSSLTIQKETDKPLLNSSTNNYFVSDIENVNNTSQENNKLVLDSASTNREGSKSIDKTPLKKMRDAKEAIPSLVSQDVLTVNQSKLLDSNKFEEISDDKNLLSHVSPKIQVISSNFAHNESNISGSKNFNNRISIEGIKINVTPAGNRHRSAKENNSSVNTRTAECKTQRSSQSLSGVNNKPSVSNTKSIVSHHEKSHQKIDAKTVRPVCSEHANTAHNKNNKPSQSLVGNFDQNLTHVEANKNVSPNSMRLTVTPENDAAKLRLPSPRSSLVVEDKVKSKIPSPRLSLKSSSSESVKHKLPSPHSSVIPEKSSDIISDTREKVPVTNPKDKNAPTSRSAELKRKTNRKSLSLNSGLTVECNSRKELTKTKSLSGPLPSDNADEFASKTVNKNVDSDRVVGQSVDKTETKVDLKFSPDNRKPLTRKTSAENDGSLNKNSSNNSKVEKDLNELLTEINLKQGEILAGATGSGAVRDVNRNTLSEITSSSASITDKNHTNSNLLLGKITLHKPVKLSTFSINDENNVIENSETVIIPNSDMKDNDIIGTSESMTDLLRELTRSLDQDFGCLTSGNSQEGDNPDSSGKFNIDQSTHLVSSSFNSFENDALTFGNDRCETGYTDEELITDEADHEVMEINRKVLSELEQKQNGANESNNTSGHEVKENNAKLPLASIKKDKNNQTISCDDDLKSSEIEVQKPSDYNSDDSNAEIVEAICKTASEISALSNSVSTTSTTNVPAPSSHVNATILDTLSSEIVTLSSSPENRRWNPQSTSCDLDQNEGTCSSTNSNKMDCSPVIAIHPSGLLMFCTLCIAQLQQLVDLDFLTVLGLLIAIISLILLLLL